MTHEIEDDLRTTAETTKADAERLAEIEAEKLRLAPDDPRLVELTAQATQLTDRLARYARHEQALTEELSTDR